MFKDRLIASISLPDFIYKIAIKLLLKKRLSFEKKRYRYFSLSDYVAQLKTYDIAVMADAANDQHYEVPVAFFNLIMGKHKKYSACYFKNDNTNLSQAEENMLSITCERALLKNNINILELGCGWGSLTLYMAKKYPDSTITAVSNSHSQREYIEQQCHANNINNVKVITQNIQDFNSNILFDRIVSIEMFEHVRNYEALFEKCASFLHKNGYMFVHIFGHKRYAYLFDDDTKKSFMARHFFSGGQMPSYDLFSQFDKDFYIDNAWVVPGTHYAKTCQKWLKNMYKHKKEIKEIFSRCYPNNVKRFWIYWRLFFLSCEVLFDTKKGSEWQVYHYLFKPNC